MPSILKIRISSARGLPIMDRSTELTDAYVSLRLGDTEEQKTRIFRKSLNPIWNEDFRFEVSDDSEIQTESLELRVMDFDQISRNDPIGQVSLDLNPLISGSSTGSFSSAPQISGWFPIYDSLKGVRGELNVTVRLEYFGDVNPFKDSSAGVQFFSMTAIPPGMQLISMLDFVEELVPDSDPEYHWSDKLRATRVSNDTRQRKMFELAGRVRKLFGKKVLDMGGNAVLGFRLCFDLEKEEGEIVARGIGVACKLVPADSLTLADLQELLPTVAHQKIQQLYQQYYDHTTIPPAESSKLTSLQEAKGQPGPVLPAVSQLTQAIQARDDSSGSGIAGAGNNSGGSAGRPLASPPFKPVSKDDPGMEKIDLDHPTLSATRERSTSLVVGHTPENFFLATISDLANAMPQLGLTPDLASQAVTLSNKGTKKAPTTLASDVQLHTIDSFVEGQILRFGGLVTARSVKMLIGDDQEIRDAWWIELREEIRSHARTLGCQAVIGYSEVTTIHDEIIVLSAIGTAANLSINTGLTGGPSSFLLNNEGAFEPPDDDGDESPDESGPSAFAGPSSHPGNSWKAAFVNAKSPKKTHSFLHFVTNNNNAAHKSCQSCHYPFSEDVNPPFRMEFKKCAVCNSALVPELIISTTEPPPELETVGSSFFIEANVMKAKKKKEGEHNAAEVSKTLPFLEYEVYRQLLYKMKVLGVNAIFGLKYELTLGEGFLVAVASGTAVFLAPLPPPKVLEINHAMDPATDEIRQKSELYQKITQTSEQNIRAMDAARLSRKRSLTSEEVSLLHSKQHIGSEDEGEIHERKNSLELPGKSLKLGEEEEEEDRTNFVVRVDDETDEDLMSLLLDHIPPNKLFTFNSTTFLNRAIPKDADRSLVLFNLQELTLLKKWNIKTTSGRLNKFLFSLLQHMREELLFSFRPNSPFCICGLSYDISFPKDTEIQILMKGMCIGYREVDLPVPTPRQIDSKDDDDMMFHMDEKPSEAQTSDDGPMNQNSAAESNPRFPSSMVDLTPLNDIPGAKIETFLGRINFFLVKESVNLHEMHGIGNFTHIFLTEAKAIARAHVVALKGNALIGFRIDKFILHDNSNKNHAYSMMCLSGDVVKVAFEDHEKTQQFAAAQLFPSWPS